MKAFAFILIFHVVILSVISNASCEDLSTGPTIVAWPNFKPIPAAKKLHDWITTETAIGETVVMYLAYHTAAQRQAISDMYDRYFPIVNKVEGKFEPSFVRDVQAAIAEPDYGTSSNVADMRTDKALYLAQQLELSFRDNKAIKKDYGYMSIICTSTGDLLRNITSAFSSNHVNLFGRTLQERLRKELWNKDLREFLLYILEEPLRLNNEVDPAKTQKYLSAIPEEEGNCAKNKLLRDLLAKESFAQIKAVGDQYQTTKQHPAIDNIDKNCKGLVGDAFTRVFKFAMNNGEYFAEQIQDYFDGKGDINNAGPVTVISRSEIDLADIRTAYKKKYNKDLDTAFEPHMNGLNHRLMQVLVLGNRDPKVINDPRFK